jgi:hypothetical protein
VQKRLPPELAEQFASKIASGGLDVSVARRIGFGLQAGSRTMGFGNLKDPTSPDSSIPKTPPGIAGANFSNADRFAPDRGSPIIRVNRRSGNFVGLVLALLIVLGILYLFLHR